RWGIGRAATLRATISARRPGVYRLPEMLRSMVAAIVVAVVAVVIVAIIAIRRIVVERILDTALRFLQRMPERRFEPVHPIVHLDHAIGKLADRAVHPLIEIGIVAAAHVTQCLRAMRSAWIDGIGH